MTSHHFAIVIDDRIVAIPYIDWQMNPGRHRRCAGRADPDRRSVEARVGWPPS